MSPSPPESVTKAWWQLIGQEVLVTHRVDEKLCQLWQKVTFDFCVCGSFLPRTVPEPEATARRSERISPSTELQLLSCQPKTAEFKKNAADPFRELANPCDNYKMVNKVLIAFLHLVFKVKGKIILLETSEQNCIPVRSTCSTSH